MANFFDLKPSADKIKLAKIGTRILYNKNAIEKIAEMTKTHFEKGELAVCYHAEDEHFVAKLERLLNIGEYVVRKVAIDSEQMATYESCKVIIDLPTKYRFIIALGGEDVSEMVRYASFVRKSSYGIVATVPDSDLYLSDKVYLENYLMPKVCKHAEYLIFDTALLSNAAGDSIASTIGILVAIKLGGFERAFRGKVLGETLVNVNIHTHLEQSINSLLKIDDNTFQTNLIYTMLLVNIATALEGRLVSQASLISAKIYISRFGKRRTGENMYISTYILNILYKQFLSSDFVDVIMPPDRTKSIKLLEKLYEIDYNKQVVTISDTNNYLKRVYLINEYRKDLQNKINGFDILSVNRRYRRSYIDAGYWLRNYAGSEELISCIALAGELSNDTLLGHIKQIGLLEEYI